MTLDLEAPPSSVPTAGSASLPVRPRRLRRTPALRALVRETRLHPSMLVAPLFVQPGPGVREPIGSMPGQAPAVRRIVAAEEAARLAELGVGGVILFGLPEAKDALGSEASGRRRDRPARAPPDPALDLPLVTIADTCLCEYTDHGHCGPLAAGRSGRQRRGARPPRRDGGQPRRGPAPTSSRRAR